MPRKSALGLGALMNARGVTDIVVISAGLSAGVIDSDAFTVLVMMALIARPRWPGLPCDGSTSGGRGPTGHCAVGPRRAQRPHR